MIWTTTCRRKAARGRSPRKYANRFTAAEVMKWPVATFLDRARLTQDGQITRTALLLLGKAESAWHLSPHPAQLTWRLEGPKRAYRALRATVSVELRLQLYQKIRNIQIRILPKDALLAVEVAKYDQQDRAGSLAQLHCAPGLHARNAPHRGDRVARPIGFRERWQFLRGCASRLSDWQQDAASLPQSLSGAGHGRVEHDRHHGLWAFTRCTLVRRVVISRCRTTT